eukprot:6210987-Pleurochrysis_carterae.AAC.3
MSCISKICCTYIGSARGRLDPSADMAANTDNDRAMSFATDMVDFLNASPTAFHAVAEVKRRLVAAGFVELDERKDWSGMLISGGAVFAKTQIGSTLPIVQVVSEDVMQSKRHAPQSFLASREEAFTSGGRIAAPPLPGEFFQLPQRANAFPFGNVDAAHIHVLLANCLAALA